MYHLNVDSDTVQSALSAKLTSGVEQETSTLGESKLCTSAVMGSPKKNLPTKGPGRVREASRSPTRRGQSGSSWGKYISNHGRSQGGKAASRSPSPTKNAKVLGY